MEVIFLGTGTSMGVPIIGCKCPVCKSDNIKDKRSRPGILLIKENYNLLIDASGELRIQLIREDVDSIDSVIITHPHADHIFGLDDTRIFSLKRKRPMDIYCSKETEKEIRSVYSYVFKDTQEGGGKPSFLFHNIVNTQKIGPFKIFPFKVYHGNLIIDAFVIDNLLIIFDASYIDFSIYNTFKNKFDYAIINGLRHTPHSTHFSVSESSYLLKALNVKKGYLMHMTHNLSYNDLLKILPENIFPAYDGLRINI